MDGMGVFLDSLSRLQSLRGVAGQPARSAAGVRLESMLAEGRAAWPGLVVSDDDYLRYLAARLKDEIADPARLEQALCAIHGRDLFLACACAIGAPRAIEAFERQHLSHVPAYVGHLNPSPAFTDEVAQLLRAKLFVAEPGAQAKIADYSGRGALTSWVRVAALRTALSLRRTTQAERAEPEEDISPSLPLRPDPEMDYIKDRYKKEFRDAFHQAFAGLSTEKRNVLRLHYVDGLNIDRIGAMFRVHRSTVARWLSSSCAQILDETRRLLRERLRLSATEFDSLAGAVRSQLDLSILTYLKEAPRDV